MKLLVVEDEPRLLELLVAALSDAGHPARACGNAEDALLAMAEGPYDAILLDWSLPGMDGLAFIAQKVAREDRTPVVLMSARGTVAERVQGLNAGADDYLVKPVAVEEVLARIEAILRRQAKQTEEGAMLSRLGDLAVQGASRALRGPRGEQLLSAREFELFMALATRRNQVISRQELRDAVWGKWISGSANVVDVYLGYVRSKVLATGSQLVALETVRGAGYSLRVRAEAT